MADSSDVSMVALKDHIGYAYSGVATTLLVKAGDTFTTTPARAERLIAKGVAAKGAGEAVAATVEPDPVEPEATPAPKVDGRTKAGKAARHK